MSRLSFSLTCCWIDNLGFPCSFQCSIGFLQELFVKPLLYAVPGGNNMVDNIFFRKLKILDSAQTSFCYIFIWRVRCEKHWLATRLSTEDVKYKCIVYICIAFHATVNCVYNSCCIHWFINYHKNKKTLENDYVPIYIDIWNIVFHA